MEVEPAALANYTCSVWKSSHTLSFTAALIPIMAYGIMAYGIMAYGTIAYGSTPYIGMTPKKNGSHIGSHK